MRKKQLLKWVPWLLAAALLYVVLRSVPLADTWVALQQLRWPQIMLLIGVNGLILLLINARWWIILRGHGYSVPFFALLRYRLAAFGVSYFTPGPHFGGEPLQVYLVEKEQQAPRVTAIAAMSLDKSLEMLVNFTFLLAGVIIIIEQRTLGESVGGEAIVFAGILLLIPLGYLTAVWAGHAPASWLLALFIRMPLWQGVARSRAPGWLARLRNGHQAVLSSEKETSDFFRRAPWAVVLALLVSIAAWVLMILEFWLMVAFLGVSLSLIQLLTALTAARIAILLLLPGSIGALEASQAFAFGAMGLNPAIGISASLLIRGRDVLVGMIGLSSLSRKWAFRRSVRQIDHPPL